MADQKPLKLSEMTPEEVSKHLGVSLKRAEVMIARATGKAKPWGEKFPEYRKLDNEGNRVPKKPEEFKPNYGSQCGCCAHLILRVNQCKAFPKGIPTTILRNEFDHRQPIEGDRGIQWKQHRRELRHPFEKPNNQ